ncbi:uncharacterized protein LOC123558702 [Mercenaria mercenaria]|uniref:uncharacterized protein LOC123558702 n=1 Tax=Mercenaria mercenaria TaxID=6596 RepID=UPI00234F5D68|nr:uncharacterized protein LOC123558702 [Mercenaria mercenaria]
MFFYFLLDGTCKRTTPVSLDLEKCVPRVGTYTEGRVDPTLWYKVLVLDSILVDCDSSTIFWSCEKSDVLLHKDCIGADEIREFFKNKEQMLCVELDPTLDEMFEASKNIFPELFERKGEVTTYENLLKILHVYILPQIEFKENHWEDIRDSLETIEKEYKNIEMLIKMNVQSRKNTEELLLKQRQQLLTEDGVSGILNNIPKTDHFVKLLLQHTEKDVRHLEKTLSVLSDKITPLRNMADETSVGLLANTRRERDVVAREIERIIVAREELVNGLILHRHGVTRSKRKKSVQLRGISQSVRAYRIADAFESYKRESAEVENLSNEIKQQINIKIRLSSVREATSLTLKEIQVDGASYGYNRKKGSLEIEADLFDPIRKPSDWATLSEHVKACLYNKKSEFRTKHNKFCTRFKDTCKSIQERAKRDFLVNFGSLATDRHALSFGSSQSHQNEAMRFSSRWLFGSVSKEDCEELCKQISDHTLRMADEIVIQIQVKDDDMKSILCKVYICYEEHISEELLPGLCKLFEQSYRTQCQQLSDWIRKHAETELGSSNTTLKGMFPELTNRGICDAKMGDDIADDRRQTMECLVDRFSETSNSLSEVFDRTRDFLLQGDREEFNDLAISQALKTQFVSAFKGFYALIQEENTAMSIFSKLRHLTRAVQSAENTFSDLRTRTGQSSEICTDDILDILILLICKLSPELLLKLYAHVNLILRLSPYFLQGSINEYSLVTITGAFQHLFERQEMHTDSVSKTRKEN